MSWSTLDADALFRPQATVQRRLSKRNTLSGFSMTLPVMVQHTNVSRYPHADKKLDLLAKPLYVAQCRCAAGTAWHMRRLQQGSHNAFNMMQQSGEVLRRASYNTSTAPKQHGVWAVLVSVLAA